MAEPTDEHTRLDSQSAADEDILVHDEQFYFQNVVFRAENTIFRVPTYALPANEGIFASMFLLPKGDSEPEGSSDKNPIHLPPDVPAFDFRSLLKACLPKPACAPPKLDVEEWMAVIKLSTMWCLDDLRAAAVRGADAVVAALDPVEKFMLAKRYSISRWLFEAAEELAKRNAPLSVEEGHRLGMKTSFAVFRLREKSLGRTSFNFKPAIAELFRDDLLLDKEYDESKLTQREAPKLARQPGSIGIYCAS